MCFLSTKISKNKSVTTNPRIGPFLASRRIDVTEIARLRSNKNFKAVGCLCLRKISGLAERRRSIAPAGSGFS